MCTQHFGIYIVLQFVLSLQQSILSLAPLLLPPLLRFYGLPMVFSTVHVLSQS